VRGGRPVGAASSPGRLVLRSCTLAFGGGFGGFGGAASGAAPAFGAPAAANQSAFGGAGAFGSATAPAFGASAAPAFGASAAPAFGAPATSAFGAPAAPSFGAPAASAFGASAAPAFGAATTAAFGVSAAPAFGATSAPTLGAAPTSAPAFGAGGGGGLFGSAQTSSFGQGGFGAPPHTGAAAAGTRGVRWSLSTVMEGTPPTASKFHSIAMMPQFRTAKCVEELRLEDGALPAVAPGAASGTAGFGFGAPTAAAAPLAASAPAFGEPQGGQRSLFGGFGSAAAAPTAAPAAVPGQSSFSFGQPACAPSAGASGNPATSSFALPPPTQSAGFGGFGAPTAVAGATAAPSTGLFGAPAGPSTGLFGAPAAAAFPSTSGQAGALPSFSGFSSAAAAPAPAAPAPAPGPNAVYQVNLAGSTPVLAPFTGFSPPVGMVQSSPEMAEYVKLAETAYKTAQDAGTAAQSASTRSDYGGIAFGLLLVAKDSHLALETFKRDFEARRAAAGQVPATAAPSPATNRKAPRNTKLLTLDPGPLRVDWTPRRTANMDNRRSLRSPPAVASRANSRSSPAGASPQALRPRTGRHSMRSMLYSIGTGQEDRFTTADGGEEHAKGEGRVRPFLLAARSAGFASPGQRNLATPGGLRPTQGTPLQSPSSWAARTPTRFSEAAAAREEGGGPAAAGKPPAPLPGRGGAGENVPGRRPPAPRSRSELAEFCVAGSERPRVDTSPPGAGDATPAPPAPPAHQSTEAAPGRGGVADSVPPASESKPGRRSAQRDNTLPFDEDDPLDYLPVMTLDGYYMSPSIADLSRLTCHELTMIEDFTIGREGHGKIRWLEPVDVRGIVVDEAVVIEGSAVEVNPGRGRAEMLGDVPTSVCLQFGVDADPRHIQQLCVENGTEFVSYDERTGRLVLKISFY
jgi:hypothetical protein